MLINLALFGPYALLLLRLVLGQIFLLHGWQKVTGKEGTGLPHYKLLGWTEVAAGTLMVLGLYTQLAALAIMVIMLGALWYKFFVWKGQTWAGNIEYDILILFAALVVAVFGPGAFTL